MPAGRALIPSSSTLVSFFAPRSSPSGSCPVCKQPSDTVSSLHACDCSGLVWPGRHPRHSSTKDHAHPRCPGLLWYCFCCPATIYPRFCMRHQSQPSIHPDLECSPSDVCNRWSRLILTNNYASRGHYLVHLLRQRRFGEAALPSLHLLIRYSSRRGSLLPRNRKLV